jgi:hypothetical protein
MRRTSHYSRCTEMKSITKTILRLTFPFATLVLASPVSAQTGIEAAFVVMGEGGSAVARVITTDATCPPITVDKLTNAMSLRAPPSLPEFPVAVCEFAIPANVEYLAVQSVILPVPLQSSVSKIVILGDTGCRMKAGSTFQHCNDPKAWPLAKVAEAAAANAPQVVVHVGDYVYREAPCPKGDQGCIGSPYGDNWPTWRTELFGPAAPLLASAPWVVARGDHETCKRSGNGFFRFLDPRPLAEECVSSSRPYEVPLGSVRLFVMDSNESTDGSDTRIADYRSQLEGLVETEKETWIITHMPFWGFRGEKPPEAPKSFTPSLQEAAKGLPLVGVSQIITGHLHAFQALSFRDGRPDQMVVGNGGTSLDPDIDQELAGMSIGGTQVKSGVAVSQFGFVTITRDQASNEWEFLLFTLDGKNPQRCLKQAPKRGLNCAS